VTNQLIIDIPLLPFPQAFVALETAMRRLIRSFGLRGMVFAIFMFSGLLQVRGEDGAPVTLDTVINSWKDREARAKAIDFVAVGTEFRPQTTISATTLKMMGIPTAEKDISVPDTSFNISLRIAVNGNQRARLDYDGKSFVSKGNGYLDQRQIETWVNSVQKVLFLSGQQDFPNAHISMNANCPPARRPRALPIMMVYRSLDNKIGVFDSNKLQLMKDKSIVDGQLCLILKDDESKLWIDPAKDYVPIRYQMIRRANIARSIDIKYITDSQHGWVPKSWKQVELGADGIIQDSVTVDISAYKISDEISDETFEVSYPPGTWVRDYIRDESYILREDGSRRMVLKSEDGKDYEDLVRPNPPNLTLRHSYWIAVVGIFLLAVFVAVLIFRILKRRRGTSVGH
jgi:hypothetical protein